ncbi:MAG TPA: DUF4340 domain-containing protein [Verrucomicrobiota bacterium]|nr:DUF4340 domain-containing protein [Verrucomicrobiota bacterium]HNU50997.1 DUF4340 domain-containing protein [Verrucomicrobiota bacterium]
MNRKQLTLILVAMVLAGALGLWLSRREAASYVTTQGRMGEKVLGEFDINTVAQVTVRHDTNTLDLAQENDVWVVRQRGGYPANFSEVREFLHKLWDLKVVQPVALGAADLGRLELAAASGTNAPVVVELKAKDGKVLKTVTLGKKHLRQAASPSPFGGDDGWPDGRYLMVDQKPEAVSLVSEPFSNIEPKADQWLNRDFFKVEKVKSVAVTYAVATNSWKLERETETGELKLADAGPEEKLDTAKVSGIPTALSWPSFTDVIIDPQPAVTGLDKPTVAVLETFDGFTYTVKVGSRKGEDAYYLTVDVAADLPKERAPGKDEKAEDKEKLDKEFKEKTDKLAEKLKQEKALGKWTYVVSKYTVDGLLKERHALLAEKKEEAAKPDAAGGAEDAAAPPMPPLVPELPPIQ